MSSNIVYVRQDKQAVLQTDAGWLPAVLTICQQPDGTPAVVHGPQIRDVQLTLLAVAQGLRISELDKQEKDKDDSPQAIAQRLRQSGFMLP